MRFLSVFHLLKDGAKIRTFSDMAKTNFKMPHKSTAASHETTGMKPPLTYPKQGSTHLF